MRIPYTEDPPVPKSETEAAIIKRILERRGPMGLVSLDRTLLHAPLVADGWNAYFKAIRTQNTLPTGLLEIAVLRLAALLRCWYAWDGHYLLAREAGVSDEALMNLRTAKPGEKLTGLDAKQQATALYAEEMTMAGEVSTSAFDGVAAFLSNRQVVELTAAIAGYNMVTRFVNALDVGERADRT